MDWINIFGLIFMVIIMIPNIIYAMKCKKGFENKYRNKTMESIEQMGRFGCFGFMIIRIPGTQFGWRSGKAFAAYLVVNMILILLYLVIWGILFKKNTVFKAVSLSVLPAIVFLFSGVMTGSIPLIVAASLFTPTHILISYRNAKT